MVDPKWLIGGGGGGAPEAPAQPQSQGPAPTPAGRTGGQRPVLTGITMKGLEKPGGEQITFVYADGFQAVETFRELAHLGFDPKLISAVGQVFDHAGDIVYERNHGGGM